MLLLFRFSWVFWLRIFETGDAHWLLWIRLFTRYLAVSHTRFLRAGVTVWFRIGFFNFIKWLFQSVIKLQRHRYLAQGRLRWRILALLWTTRLLFFFLFLFSVTFHSTVRRDRPLGWIDIRQVIELGITFKLLHQFASFGVIALLEDWILRRVKYFWLILSIGHGHPLR